MFTVFLEFLTKLLLYIPKFVWAKFLGAGTYFLQWAYAICVYCQTGSITSILGMLPGPVWYFLEMLAIAQGFKISICAFVIRFAIRRIPGIG